jgi:hypothetical protein
LPVGLYRGQLRKNMSLHETRYLQQPVEHWHNAPMPPFPHHTKPSPRYPPLPTATSHLFRL